MSTLFQRNILTVFEGVTANSVHRTSMLHSNEAPVSGVKDKFNGNNEKRHPPPRLTGHEIYEMVKDVHVVLGKWKMTGKNTGEDDMWKK
jgi:hypothetical protein